MLFISTRRNADDPNRWTRVLAPYIATVVLLAIGGVILVSQRARITRLGRQTALLRAKSRRTEATVCRLRCQIARLTTADRLAALAERFELDLVPPEDALTHDEPDTGNAP